MASLRMGLVLIILIPFWRFKIPEKKYFKPSFNFFFYFYGCIGLCIYDLSFILFFILFHLVIVGSQLAIPFGILASAFILKENISSKKWFLIFTAFVIGVLIIFFDPKLSR